jgi:hypothetical protein
MLPAPLCIPGVSSITHLSTELVTHSQLSIVISVNAHLERHESDGPDQILSHYRKRKKNDRVPAFAYVVSFGTGSILTLSAMSRVTPMAFFHLLLPLSSINIGRKSASTLALLETLGTLHWLSGGGDGGGCGCGGGGGGYSEGSS